MNKNSLNDQMREYQLYTNYLRGAEEEIFV